MNVFCNKAAMSLTPDLPVALPVTGALPRGVIKCSNEKEEGARKEAP